MDKLPISAQFVENSAQSSALEVMKSKWFLIALLSLFTFSAIAAEPPWRYQLLEGSSLADECLICGRPTIIIPMRGSFTLRRGSVSPISQTFSIENANFQAGP